MSTNCSFAGAIRSAARDAGREPTPDQVADLDSVLQSVATIGEDRTLHIELDGKSLSFDAFIGRELSRMPRAPVPEAPKGSPTTDAAGRRISSCGEYVLIHENGGTRWARRDSAMAGIVTGWQEQERAALTREAARWPNPFAPEHFNRTRQTILTKTDPARAAMFRAQAGA